MGDPVARITCVHRDNELAMRQDEIDACCEVLDAAGFEAWRVNTEPGVAIHEVFTARMGANSEDSVLNSFCQSWDVQNLFVMDGSCFVSQGVHNPTLIMMEPAARSCAIMVLPLLIAFAQNARMKWVRRLTWPARSVSDYGIFSRLTTDATFLVASTAHAAPSITVIYRSSRKRAGWARRAGWDCSRWHFSRPSAQAESAGHVSRQRATHDNRREWG
jgi:hypothetical protein